MNVLHGLLVLDKPSGITSRAAVDRAQSWFPRGARIGHTGTLDPLASGVLVLCIGVATRLTEYVQRMPKVYRATITLGATSDTDDADGTITPFSPLPLGAGPGVRASDVVPSRVDVDQALATFIGTISQVPPAFSAAKVTGRRAYALARKGESVDLAPRPVTIHRIDVTCFAYPALEIMVHCGKGTYIRSLARDLGQRLGCGGYISELRRLEVGPFNEADAIALDAAADAARGRLLPAWRAVQAEPPVVLSDVETAKLSQGQRIPTPGHANENVSECVVANSPETFFAVVEIVDGWMQPIKVLCKPPTAPQ